MTFPGTHAITQPDHPAVIMAHSGEVVTYRQLDERSNQLAHLWYERGLRPGDHIAILLENDPRYFDVVWAALRSGLSFTPVNWHLTGPEVDYIITDCGARAVVTAATMAERVAGVRVEIPLVIDGDIPGWERYDDAVASQPTTPLAHQPDGVGMYYSSGTTGQPKGIVFPPPDRMVYDEHPVLAYKSPLTNGPEDIYLSPAPLYHTAPLATCTFVHRAGGTAVVMERWDPQACLAAIEHYGVTSVQFVPTMFVRLLKLPPSQREGYDLSTLRLVTHAAAPCPVAIKEQMMEWFGPIIWEYYAGSENVGSTLISPQEWLTHPGSVGRPRFTTVHICDDAHREVPAGEVGTIWFDTPGAQFEYHGDPAKTAAARSPEGWFNLGDVGYLDDEGYLYLTDRQSFMIISGGVNIYPQEAENILILHPAVADAAVIGVPNDEFGEEVKGIVQLLDPSGASPAMAADLLAFCRQHLAAFKCPRTIDFEAELPRQDTGKLYKRLLKDRYWGDRPSRIV